MGADGLQRLLRKERISGVGPVLGARLNLLRMNAFAVDDVGFRPHVGVEEFGRGLRRGRER